MKQGVFIGLIGFCVGISIGEYRPLALYVAIFILCVTFGLLIIKRFMFRFQTKYVYVCVIVLSGISLGLIRTEYAYTRLPDSIFDTSIGIKQELKIKVVSPVDVRESSARFIAKPIIDGVSDTQVPYIRVTLPRMNEVTYGDVIILEGIVVSIMTNSKTYARASESLVRRGILYEVRLPEIKSIESGKGNLFYMKLYSFGDDIKHRINVYVREPSAGFINGILLGEKHGLSDEWYDKFTNIGLTHVIVLSGYNLAIIFAWTRIALRRAPFFVQHLCGAFAVIALMLVSGAEAPAVRAAILVLTASLAALLRRQEDAGYFLSLTVLAMLLWNPFYLLYDISFQLSVAATYGLTYFAPALGRYIFNKPKFAHELVRDTMSAQIVVLPLQLFYFGTLSWVSLFANILILPFIPILMILGAFVLIFSFVPFLGLCAGTITTLLSDVVLSMVSFFASHTQIISISISLLTFFLLYALIIIFISNSRKVI